MVWRAWKAATPWRNVLFGDVNPSGKLPCTFPKRLADSPATALDAYPGENGTVVYKEGLLVGYRWYDTKDIDPLFPFGYGLSYTHFAYTNLNLVPDNGPSGLPLTVEFELANTGDRAGAEVAEVYVQPVNPGVFRPVKELKGFAKVFLQPGEKQTVSVTLNRKCLRLLRRGHPKLAGRQRRLQNSGRRFLARPPAHRRLSVGADHLPAGSPPADGPDAGANGRRDPFVTPLNRGPAILFFKQNDTTCCPISV